MKKVSIVDHKANGEDYDKNVMPIDERINHWQTSKWAQELSSTLPRFEFELHIERWVEGIDTILYSIANGTVYKTQFGRYGDFTAETLNQMELRANAVERWVGEQDPRTELEVKVYRLLGNRDPNKLEAAQAFIEITRTFVERGFAPYVSEKWRARVETNDVLKRIFHGEGLDRGLNDGGGYWIVNKLDLILSIIGGAAYDEVDVDASCNVTLRHVFRDDRKRMLTAKGYLVGLSAYLKDHEISDIRHDCPDLAGYAIKAYRCFRESKYYKPERDLIAKKLFYTIRFWYIRALIFAVDGEVTEEDRFLPALDLGIAVK